MASGLGPKKQPSCFCSKRAAIIFSGYLSNLNELVEELQYRSANKLGTSYESYESDFGAAFSGSGGQGMLAAETVLRMFLQSSDPDSLPMLLSELQARKPVARNVATICNCKLFCGQ